MRYGPLLDQVGLRPLQEYFLPASDAGSMKTGVIVAGVDNYWGGGEFLYVQANGTIRQWGLCVVTPALVSGQIIWQATETGNTANQARGLGVAIMAMATGNYGWLQVSGLIPINSTASVAAATVVGIAGAGQAGANSAGKEILNAVNILAATTTVAKTVLTTSGSPTLRLTGNNDIGGWFVGIAVTGTGIPASTTLSGIDPSGQYVTLSANATASGGITATGTYNDGTSFYNVVQGQRIFCQGAIT